MNQKRTGKEGEKNRFLNLKPVTPKSLSMFNMTDLRSIKNVGLSFTAPAKAKQETERKRIFTATCNKRSNKSPVPAFAKEYVQSASTTASKTVLRPHHLMAKPKPKTVKPQKTREKKEKSEMRSGKTPLSSHKRSNTHVEDLNKTQENKIFRMYKPQILHFSPRSKIKIYSTVNFGETIVKPQKRDINLTLLNLSKPQISCQKHLEEDSQVQYEPIEYLKPAMTFGEKLWRLNEVSIFSMIAK